MAPWCAQSGARLAKVVEVGDKEVFAMNASGVESVWLDVETPLTSLASTPVRLSLDKFAARRELPGIRPGLLDCR